MLPQDIRVGDPSATLECKYELDGVHVDKVVWFKDQAEFYTFQPGHPPLKDSKPLPGVRVDVSKYVSLFKHCWLQYYIYIYIDCSKNQANFYFS